MPPVHPRVCGERGSGPPEGHVKNGSSPRVRGTRFQVNWDKEVHRFIPACAGNAGVLDASAFNPPVHPRVCGERLHTTGCCGGSCGSSPRVRGTRSRPRSRRSASRFIPACAGNAVAVPGDLEEAAVHPRVCGERGCTASTAATVCGSSPRVRGTRLYARAVLGHRRFIPACAGNAARRKRGARTTPVHPRVCGERSGRRNDRPGADGSSPRVRGTLLVLTSQ